MIKDLVEIKDSLYKALDNCGMDEETIEDIPDIKLSQDLRIDDRVLNRNGKVLIIQNQQVSIKIMRNITNALRIADSLIEQMSDSENTRTLMDCLFRGFYLKKVPLPKFQKVMGRGYINFVRSLTKTKTECANKLGVVRATLDNYMYKNPDDIED